MRRSVLPITVSVTADSSAAPAAIASVNDIDAAVTRNATDDATFRLLMEAGVYDSLSYRRPL
jgi:hypothetical protein